MTTFPLPSPEEDDLTTELAKLALRLARRAAGKPDTGEHPLADDALDTFKILSQWDAQMTKIRRNDPPDDGGESFSETRRRLAAV